MRRSRAIAFFVLASCAANSAAARGPASWCNTERSHLTFEERPDVTFWPVRSEHMTGAVDSLQSRSAIELSSAEAGRLAAIIPRPEGGRYYLVRANVFAPPRSSMPQLVEATKIGSYHLWTSDDHAFVAAAQPAGDWDVIAHNIAMIAHYDGPIRSLGVACYYIP